ncbi:BcPKS20, polyketide synthase [Aspergillus sclerotiicarbonarius CBS 121057]|uniref:BcPKS20, polyketide synthase n=1 Tax=Aspergillus sclerotiicarbonarius (strain CBS 121057 / IBT 28362) TaxID=1448318 RepID=A0A319DVE7_ASPSB|nr:BcPKS20, polyketide synthase [Aspergillus sclerotiicarbonarius CBS 121057]
MESASLDIAIKIRSTPDMTLQGLVHRVNWAPAALSDTPLAFQKIVFLVNPNGNPEPVPEYQRQLADAGYTTTVVQDANQLESHLTPRTIVVHIPNVARDKDSVYEAAKESCASLIAAARILSKHRVYKLFSVFATSAGIAELGHAPLYGLARVLKMEVPDTFGGLFEADSGSFPLPPIRYAQGFDVVRVSQGVAHTAFLQPFLEESNETVPHLRLRPESSYLITGGTRGMGLEIATWMGKRGAGNLILVSRQGLLSEGPENGPSDDKNDALTSRIKELKGRGVAVHVLAIDLALPGTQKALQQAIGGLQLPPIKGVVHAAGVAGYHTVNRCAPSDLDYTMAPKALGALALDRIFPPEDLDFFLLTSSVGQLVGFPGQLTYAPANAFLDGFAVYRRRKGDACTSIQWTAWRGVGLMVESKSATRTIVRGMQARGISDVRPDEALATLESVIQLSTDHAAVVRAVTLEADEPLRHPILQHITPRRSVQPTHLDHPAHAVAIVGMACRTAAGDTTDDLWRAIQTGQTTVRAIDARRFPEAATRKGTKLWGNFLSDPESFDHGFFKKSKRESAALDPHQRVLMETTYHALESAGWLAQEQRPETHERTLTGATTGCFIGMNAPDYPLNLACHPVSPYTGFGMLRSFVAGRLSHHFGWTGPSHTIDTACSSAMVAIHQACRAIQAGECTQAVAGGVNLITNTALFDALRAGGFLSETGPCKTFDAQADGYCRGEAVGVLVLKPLSRALQDGDNVRGILLGTGNNQNLNHTSITNPVLESQAALYRDVLARGGITPHQVSYVEAHGTGTRAGDPVEVEGIRQVLGGPERASLLHIGGIKANIGHSEGASGVISLIKVLLMMKHRQIPPQANFERLNPSIAALGPDRMAISTSLQEWRSPGPLVALVNSFGASGNNAAALVASPPPPAPSLPSTSLVSSGALSTWPVFISAASKISLSAYCQKLKKQIVQPTFRPESSVHLGFELAATQNWQLDHVFTTTVTSLPELQVQLSSPEKHTMTLQTSPQPIVLLFSGQNGNTVPAAQSLYDASVIFRNYLHRCEEVVQSLDGPRLFPAVLEGIDGGDGDNIVLRHAAMFAIQYSSGMTWLECGVEPQAVCGHSFGEWAALTVSGAMTLEAGLKLVTGKTGRASIIQKFWGPDPGSMIAIEADLVETQTSASQHLEPFRRKHPECTLDIACYNGPNHYVVAGPTPDIDLLETELVQEKKSCGAKLRFKVLRGMHAYHSAMADSIIEESARLSATIPFQVPTLPFESCHQDQWTGPGTNVIARNTRGPVCFADAMDRIVTRLGGPCLFLEAGFGGPIVAMARNALSCSLIPSKQSPHSFVAIGGKDPVRGLAEGSLALWRNGHPSVRFWPFHAKQRASYLPVTLPPYRFEKHAHWLEHIPLQPRDRNPHPPHPPQQPAIVQHSGACAHCGKGIGEYPYIALDAASSGQDGSSVFRIDPRSNRYQDLVKGHVIAGSPISSAAMYLELVAHAVVQGGHTDVVSLPSPGEIWVEALEIKAPLGLDPQRSVLLTLTRKGDGVLAFELSSTNNPGRNVSSKPTSHATGVVSVGKKNSGLPTGPTDRWARLTHLIEKEPDIDALRGAMVYKVFAKMVKYSAGYRGLRYIVGKGGESAGMISMPADAEGDERARSPNDGIADPMVMDTFLQVPGAFVHSLRVTDRPDEDESDMSYICTGMGSVGPLTKLPGSGSYRAYTKIQREDQKEVVLDLVAFDAETARVVWAVQGLKFSRVPRPALVKALAAANPAAAAAAEEVARELQAKPTAKQVAQKVVAPKVDRIIPLDILDGVRQVLTQSLDVPPDDVRRQAMLEELGTDSLVSAEIQANIGDQFGIDISTEEFAALTTVADLCQLVRTRLGSDAGDSGAAMPISDSSHDTADEVTAEWQQAVLEILSHSLEVPVSEIQRDSALEDLGADSLITPEILSNIKQSLHVDLSPAEFAASGDVGSLLDLLAGALGVDARPTPTASDAGTSDKSMQTAFQEIRRNFDAHAKACQLTGYWEQVYPVHLPVVSAFILDAFEKLGCPIRQFQPGEILPPLQEKLPKYHREVARLWDILQEAGIIEQMGANDFVRGPAPLARTPVKPAVQLSQELIAAFPPFASTHGLPDLLGPHLAECLTGQADPVSLLFGRQRGLHLLEDYYANGPDLRAATQVLGDFVSAAIAQTASDGEPFRILEVGAGTGGTTKHLIPLLQAPGLPFTYTFTELSCSLLARARRTTFAGVPSMEFRKFDLEVAPEPELHGRYHLVISSNCVHATRDLRRSLQHIWQLLRPDDGCVALVEVTQKRAWYDLVWGLMDGWWHFDDGRDYALQSPWAWERAMRDSGFAHVDWSESVSRESRSVRVLCGFTSPTSPEKPPPLHAPSTLLHRGPASTGRNLFLCPDGFGSGAVFTALAPFLARVPDISAYALNSPFLAAADLDLDPLPSIEELAGIYLAAIKRRQPAGPYLLGGYSVGGVVAFEVARQLLEEGDIVERLVLIDSAYPSVVPSMPNELVQLLDAIDATNCAQPLSSAHFTLAREQLRQYRASPLPGPKGLIRDVVLFSAREGVDKQTTVPRPQVRREEQSTVDWLLDDRTDDHSTLGWEDVLQNVRVVRTDGNHFSLMTTPIVNSWGLELANILAG